MTTLSSPVIITSSSRPSSHRSTKDLDDMSSERTVEAGDQLSQRQRRIKQGNKRKLGDERVSKPHSERLRRERTVEASRHQTPEHSARLSEGSRHGSTPVGDSRNEEGSGEGSEGGRVNDLEGSTSESSPSSTVGAGSEMGSLEGCTSWGREATRNMNQQDGSGETSKNAERERVCNVMEDLLDKLYDGKVEDDTADGVLRLMSERLNLLERQKEGMVAYFLRQLHWELPRHGASTEAGGKGRRKGLSGLGTACATVAAMTTPFTTWMSPVRGKTEDILEDPIVGSAYAMVLNDNAPDDEEAIKVHFLRTIGQSIRSARSKVAIAHRRAFASVFEEVFDEFAGSEHAKSQHIMRVLQDSLEAGITARSTEQWMRVGYEGLASVLDQHQKAFNASGGNKRLKLMDLIMSECGANTERRYAAEVLQTVAKEAVTKTFATWVQEMGRKGVIPTLESVKELRTRFVQELVRTDQGKGGSGDEGENGAEGDKKRGGRSRGWRCSRPWTVERAGKKLRSEFGNKLFDALGCHFAGAGGTAVRELGKASKIDELNAVFRPYLNAAEGVEVAGENEVGGGMQDDADEDDEDDEDVDDEDSSNDDSNGGGEEDAHQHAVDGPA